MRVVTCIFSFFKLASHYTLRSSHSCCTELWNSLSLVHIYGSVLAVIISVMIKMLSMFSFNGPNMLYVKSLNCISFHSCDNVIITFFKIMKCSPLEFLRLLSSSSVWYNASDFFSKSIEP